MKKMKALLSGLVLVGLTLTGCGNENKSESTDSSQSPTTNTDNSSADTSVTTAPSAGNDSSTGGVDLSTHITGFTFSGLEDLEVNQGQAVNAKEGVRVTATLGDNVSTFIVTSYVTVTQGEATITANLDTSKVGEFVINYTVDTSRIAGFTFADGIELSASRNMKVNEVIASADELIVNGTFDTNDSTGWTTYTDGSTVTFDYSKGYMECVETSISGNAYSPRLNTDYSVKENEFTLVYGTTYQVSIDLMASANKRIRMQIGTLFPAAPYWAELVDTDGNALIHDYQVTTSWTTYTWQFTLASNTCENTHLTLEMGTVEGDATVATVSADNISIRSVQDDGSDKIAPAITGVGDYRVAYAAGSTETVDVLAGVTASDNVDGDLTSSITAEIKDSEGKVVTSISKGTVGVYTVTYKVTDAAGNERTATATIKVVDAQVLGTNYANPTTLVSGGEEEMNTANAYDSFYYWYVQDASWNCGPVVDVTSSYTDGKLTIDATNFNSNPNVWSSQLFYRTEELDAGTYTVSFKVTSSVARSIIINNGDPIALNEGVNNISYTETLTTIGSVRLFMQLGGATLCESSASKLEFEDLSIVYSASANVADAPTALVYDNAGGGSQDELNAAAVTDTWYYWYAADNSWNCGNAPTTTASFTDGALTVEISNYNGTSEQVNTWTEQLFYKIPAEVAGTYKVTMDVNSSVERKIDCNGTIIDLKAGANTVTFDVITTVDGSFNLVILLGLGELYSGSSSTFTFANLNVVQVA